MNSDAATVVGAEEIIRMHAIENDAAGFYKLNQSARASLSLKPPVGSAPAKI